MSTFELSTTTALSTPPPPPTPLVHLQLYRPALDSKALEQVGQRCVHVQGLPVARSKVKRLLCHVDTHGVGKVVASPSRRSVGQERVHGSSYERRARSGRKVNTRLAHCRENFDLTAGHSNYTSLVHVTMRGEFLKF